MFRMKLLPLIWSFSVSCLIYSSSGLLQYDPVDNYLIDCGSSTNTTVGNRVFVSDHFYSNFLSTSSLISANTSSTSIPYLIKTVRIFSETSIYTFPVKKNGWHFVRLHFFPFVSGEYNLSNSKFSVSAQNFTLIKEFHHPGAGYMIREYSLNATSDSIRLTFSPSTSSIAFVNAIEVLSLPDGLIPEGARTVGGGSPGTRKALLNQALETVARVNMGNVSVSPQNDTLWRSWESDHAYLKHASLATFVSDVKAVNFTGELPTEYIAPPMVYGTATKSNSDQGPNFRVNVTWLFDVDPGFQYLIRFHFCDILSVPHLDLVFNVYVGPSLASHFLDLDNMTSGIVGAPYYMDVVTGAAEGRMLNVSVGPSSSNTLYTDAILNGLEIMKISNSKDSLDALDSTIFSKGSKMSKILVASLVVAFVVAVASALLVFLVCRRKKRLGHVGDFNDSANTSLFSTSKFAYRFPFAAIREATDDFSESLLIGVGGFGKVYKGVLRDGTVVAIKRGSSSSQSQGVSEFRTEIEMLSQFRHRHLVSLMGYCYEKNELIILYEYMENGTIKDHLYGSDRPGLSWTQRLQICIGAAKGLHYLHTGSAKAIIHRDVKSANILLDESLMAKVSDFGISKVGPEIDESHVSTAVKGSFGYLDPEYLVRQQLTEKSDVYSFGVVMFEVLCGRAVIDPSRPREQVNLIEWVINCQRRGNLKAIVDPLLSGQVHAESLKKFADIAEKCLAGRGVDRPSMGDVLWNLECALQIQVQASEEMSNRQATQQVIRADSFEAGVSTAEFNSSSVGDLAGVSMSKVFAQMVNEEMR